MYRSARPSLGRNPFPRGAIARVQSRDKQIVRGFVSVPHALEKHANVERRFLSLNRFARLMLALIAYDDQAPRLEIFVGRADLHITVCRHARFNDNRGYPPLVFEGNS